ncbi:MAG: NADH dehydrogenase (quinone) subunit D [Candidatus Omnitrophota bacterium]|jgi:NADH-quinone oxidoreductase subunit D|nr:MAG: NADH dehydrogenase (quinone) subunit D [Candidatus Omnitrophota bacterium]
MPYKLDFQTDRRISETIKQLNNDHMVLNMGPQHPSTHGVLRLVIELDGEEIVDVIPDIGYLHRGMEKLAEAKGYHRFIPFTDRLDYLAPMSNNTGLVLTVEKLIGIEAPPRAQYLRVILCELARISSHLLWLGTSALDIGAMSVFLYTFRERETIYDIFEEVCGARFTVSYMRVGGVSVDVPPHFVKMVQTFIDDFGAKIEEYATLLTDNKIWRLRTEGIGVISGERAVEYGMTGPCLRGSGVDVDLRRDNPYLVYDELDFNVPLGENGDTFDRYLVRMEEMRQSRRIIRQALKKLPGGLIKVEDNKVSFPKRSTIENSMEALIHHFLLSSDGVKAPAGEVYMSIEAPKGELGFYAVGDGSPYPKRMRIRSPSFVNLSALPEMSRGHMIADVVAIIGTIDLVLGDCDR